MCDLRWLPVKYRVQFKILLLTFKCQYGLAPGYLGIMFQPDHLDLAMCNLFLKCCKPSVDH